MLELVLALLLAGASLNDPGLGSPGLDDRSDVRSTVHVAGTGDNAGGRDRESPRPRS